MKRAVLFVLCLCLAAAMMATPHVPDVSAQGGSISLSDIKVVLDPDGSQIRISGKVTPTAIPDAPGSGADATLNVYAEYMGRSGEWPLLPDNWTTQCSHFDLAAIGDRCLTETELKGVDCVRRPTYDELGLYKTRHEGHTFSFEDQQFPGWGARYLRITARLNWDTSHPISYRRFAWDVSEVCDLVKLKGELTVDLSYSPSKPKPSDKMDFTTRAYDKDGKPLTREDGAVFEWYRDGEKLPVNASTAYWDEPPGGCHTVTVKVTHRDVSAERSVQFCVTWPAGGGRITYRYGSAEIKHAGSDKWEPLGDIIEISPGDHIRTRKRGRLEITLPGEYFVSLYDDSHLIVPSRPTSGEQPSVLELIWGRIWVHIKNLATGEVFEIQCLSTASAPKGTKFEVAASEDGSTMVHVFEGIVEVRDRDGPKAVTVNAGETTACESNGVCSDPEAFDPESLDRWWEAFPGDRPSGEEVAGLVFESRSGASGSSAQVPLTLTGTGETVGNMDISLSYDSSVLEATEVINGSLTADSLLDYNVLDGTIRVGLADSQGFAGEGSVAYVKFDVVGEAGSYSPLQVQELLANRASDYEALDISTYDGVFMVLGSSEGTGDCDGDGQLTALDALCALQMAVGKRAEDLTLDISGDGKVSSIDAREILMIAVGLEAQL